MAEKTPEQIERERQRKLAEQCLKDYAPDMSKVLDCAKGNIPPKTPIAVIDDVAPSQTQPNTSGQTQGQPTVGAGGVILQPVPSYETRTPSTNTSSLDQQDYSTFLTALGAGAQPTVNKVALTTTELNAEQLSRVLAFLPKVTQEASPTTKKPVENAVAA